MATIRNLGLGDVVVEGSEMTVTVLASLDDVNGATYKLYDEDDERLAVLGDRDAAIELAEQYADGEFGDTDEGDMYMSDSEADADVLASAGWGTDEDYGDFGDM